MSKLLSLHHTLLDPQRHVLEAPSTFAACLNSRGLYNSMQFVLRLSPRVHQLIDAVTPGIYPQGELDAETIQAYSTYLHETVHWWQHIGSTTGLIISLCYPAQSHANLDFLREVINLTGLHKSLKKWSENAARAGTPESDLGLRSAHSAVNNAVDVEFFKIFVMQPELASDIYEDPYFECIGHCFYIAYSSAVDLIASTLDRDCKFVPDVGPWAAQMKRLAREKHEGFYYGSPIRKGPVGVRAIFEGQARFIQLQYLCFGSRDLPCDELRKAGYFDGIYGEAFEGFLKLTGCDWPDQIEHPLVALFLLICDLSINPNAGFPSDIDKFESFIFDTDPGCRFVSLCGAAKLLPKLRAAITQYSRDEYVAVAGSLCEACEYGHPLFSLRKIVQWTVEAPGFVEIMAEKETFQFGAPNLPVRVLISHFAAYSRDKFARPEFFCWAGAWMSGARANAETQRLFLNHLSLFSDRADNDGVFPRDIPGKDREGVFRTLNTFYGNNIIYDLTRQWILQDGPFQYEYRWLTSERDQQRYVDWAKAAFEGVYGAKPDSFEVL